MKKFTTFETQLGESVVLTDKAKLSLYKKSQNSGYSIDILEEVYRRGYSIWNDSFGGTPDSFAFDRVNSFVAGGFASQLDEDLRQWFDPNHPKGGWKRINSKGEAIGPCAREPGEPKPKCMSNEKRAQLSKKERAAAVASKRRHDPVADRSGKGGKPVNVSNVGKGKISEEYLEEKNEPTNPSLWSKAKSLARSKFDVYPSAYANGWAAKWYKSKGGGWKSVSEESIQEQTAIIAAGTNDWNNSENSYSGVSRMIRNSKARGENPVLVLPNKNVRGNSNAYDGAYRAAKDAGIPTEYPSSFDKDGIHISRSAASQIKQKYGNIPAYGDSNSVRLGAIEGKTGFTGKSSNYIASKLPNPSTNVANTSTVKTSQPNTSTNVVNTDTNTTKSLNIEPVKTVKTSGGDYPVYSKGSEPADSFKSAFNKAYTEKPGSDFKWTGSDKVERMYKAIKEKKELEEKCWTGYKQIGMKKKGGKSVPNCVPANEDAEAHSKDFTKPSSRFIGSDELTDIYKKQTPGQIIKKVVREHLQEVAMAMPPQVTPPAIVGQVKPGVRVAPRPTEVSGRASGRTVGQSGSMSARPNVSFSKGGVQPSIERSWKTPGRGTMGTGGGSMSATPKVSTSYSQGGVNVGKGMAASKQTSPVVKGMTSAGREAMAGVEKVAPTLAKGLGTAARIASGPAATAAMAVMSPTAANAGEDEKKRQETLKSYNPFKAQGRSVSDYEKQTLTPQKYEAPKTPAAPKVDAPTPPSRPEFFSRGEAFKAAREKAGGGEGQFKYDNKPFQTNVPGEKYIAPEKQKQTGIEAESGGKTLKKIKEAISEATYKGKKVPLNKPMAGDVKKSKVFVDPDGDGKAQKVNFGDKNMSIKKDQPARKKSYCARSGGQGNLTDKTSANYWSRRAWNCEETEGEQ